MVVLSALRRLPAATCLIFPLALSAQEIRLSPAEIAPRSSHDFGLTVGEFAAPAQLDRFRGAAEEIGRQAATETAETIRQVARDLGVNGEEPETAEALAAAPGIARLPEGIRASILVSANLGENTLAEMFDRYRLRKDVRFIFRGIPEGMTVPQFGLWLSKLTALTEADMDAAPADMNIILDPELFALTGARLAPTIILEDLNASRESGQGDGMDLGRIIARAEGYSDPDWLHEQFETGSAEGLTNPNVVEITEEDLRIRAEREAHQVAARLTRDPEVLKTRFWDRTARALEAMPVTPAAADRRRQLHFLFRTAEPIRDHQGTILAHAGEVFQPGDVAPFDRRIFVVDPNRPAELAFVEAALAAPRPGVTRALIIATDLPGAAPGQDPWQGLQAMITRFGMQVFLLNDQFRESFQIEHTPTEIYPEAIGGSVEVISQEVAIQ